jgi:hypothetical protein
MFKNLFKTKKITIPQDNAQEITELESWTVKWKSYVHDFSTYGKEKFNAKVFIDEQEALEFEKQLNECAKFINSTVHVDLTKN